MMLRDGGTSAVVYINNKLKKKGEGRKIKNADKDV